MKHLAEIFFTFTLLALTVYVLSVGSSLLIPLFIAIVIWYLIISIAGALKKVSLFGRHLPPLLALLGSIGLCFFMIYMTFDMLTVSMGQFIAELPVYQERFIALTNKILASLGLEKVFKNLELFDQGSIVRFASGIAQTLTTIAGNMGIIAIYVLFLLLEYQSFDTKLAAIFSDKQKLQNTQNVISEISLQIQSYTRIKITLSIITAFLSYLVMRFVGVDFAIFWAQLIFLLNFIPTIGSILATILPCLLTILQFDSWYPFFIVTTVLTAIQFTIGNIIEPRLIGKSVNLSGLVIVISLALWSKIWGIAGMFLCVPIMVILNIIFANFERTRPIAIMLSSNGKIDRR